MKTRKWLDAVFMYAKFSPCTSGVASGIPLDQCPCFKNVKRMFKSWTSSKHLEQALAKALTKDSEIDQTKFTNPDPDAGFDAAPINIHLSREMKRLGLRLVHITAIKRFPPPNVVYFSKGIQCKRYYFGLDHWWICIVQTMATAFPVSRVVFFLSFGICFYIHVLINGSGFNRCTGFTILDAADKNRIVDVVLPEMITLFSRAGHATDKDMDKLMVPAGYCATPDDPNVSAIEFSEKKAINQRRATIFSNVEQQRMQNEFRLAEVGIAKERTKVGVVRVAAYKALRRVNDATQPTGTVEELRGMLEALDVPFEKYCKGSGVLTMVSKLKLKKNGVGGLLELVREVVREAMVDEMEVDDYEDDDFEDDTDL